MRCLYPRRQHTCLNINGEQTPVPCWMSQLQSMLNEAAWKDPTGQSVTVAFTCFCTFPTDYQAFLSAFHMDAHNHTRSLIWHGWYEKHRQRWDFWNKQDKQTTTTKTGCYCTKLLNVVTTWTSKSELHSICCLNTFIIIHSKFVSTFHLTRHCSTLTPSACNCHTLLLFKFLVAQKFVSQDFLSIFLVLAGYKHIILW